MLVENKGDELFRLLRLRISAMPDGAEFPSVRRLMEEYGVSQATVTAGVRKLRELGLIESFVGRGTFVRRPAAETPPKVLLLANDWPSRGIAEMIELLRGEAQKRGLHFELKYFNFKEDICSKLDEFEADAIVVDGLPNDFLSLEQITRIHRCCVPVVISRSIVRVEEICYVCGNNSEAGAVAANHLYQAGHRKLGVLFSEPHLFSVNELVNGFSLSARTNLCRVELFDCCTVSGESSSENAYRYVLEHFRGGVPDISALFVVSDGSAAGALQALDELGIRVPEDLSVLGFGNTLGAESGLSSVYTPRSEMACRIFDIIEDRLRHRRKLPGHIEVSPVVAERTSVKKFSPKQEEMAI